MPSYQLTLRGYDSETDLTDDLIKWVWAPSREAFNVWLLEAGIRTLLREPIEHSIDEMGKHADEYSTEDGIDVLLDERGKAMQSEKCWLYWHKQITVLTTPPKNVYEGRLVGRYKEQTVYLNDKKFDHALSLKIVNHSPDGFSWGYCGSGPGQLALAILLEETGNVKYAIEEHNEFMRREIAIQDQKERFYMTTERVHAYIDKRRERK